jgi:predicted type IV restriction endonuclease
MNFNEIIEEIRNFIIKGYYKNEEQVKIGIVLRVLNQFGWSIWDPNEVVSEYKVSDEDNTKVDFALFYSKFSPAVYIEAKSMNRADSANLSEIERQLRNYNRDNTAPLTIITDGKMWYFYLSQTGGTFSKKRFKDINWLKDTNDEIEESFRLFLKKEEHETGSAIRKANEFLNLTRKQVLIGESLHDAKTLADQPPFPSLVEAMIKIVKDKGVILTREEAIDGIKKARSFSDETTQTHQEESVPPRQRVVYTNTKRIFNNIDHTQRDSRFSEIYECKFDGKYLNKIGWNALLRVVFTKAFSLGWLIDRMHSETGINMFDHDPKTHGYNPIGYKNYYSLDVDATKAAKNIELLCIQLNLDLLIKYKYTQGPQVGKTGVIVNNKK